MNITKKVEKILEKDFGSAWRSKSISGDTAKQIDLLYRKEMEKKLRKFVTCNDCNGVGGYLSHDLGYNECNSCGGSKTNLREDEDIEEFMDRFKEFQSNKEEKK